MFAQTSNQMVEFPVFHVNVWLPAGKQDLMPMQEPDAASPPPDDTKATGDVGQKRFR